MPFLALEKKESPAESQKRWCKVSVAILKESVQFGCVSQDSLPRKSIPRKSGDFGSKHTVKFFNFTCLAPNLNSVKKESIARYYPKVCAS